MTKQEMIQYLNAVCDVEGAVYYYEETVDSLKQKRDSIGNMDICPRYIKTRQAPFFDYFSDYKVGFWISGALWLAALIYDLVSMNPITWFNVFLTLLVAYVCGCVLQAVGCFLFDFLLKGKRRADEKKAHEMSMRLYEEDCAIRDKAVKEMDEAIDGANKKCGELKLQRSKLYAMNVLHPNFQNMLAVNQIRDYLEMGICDKLEGANGAYAQYMQDVRAKRICASIDELRETVKAGISQMKGQMSAILFEVGRTNDSINAMNASISSGLSSMEETNARLRNISDTLRNVGHNEYIALKESNVSAYLRRID